MAITRNYKEIKLNKLFAGVPAIAVKSVFNSDNFMEVPEGDVIYQTGDEADCLFLLIKGEAKIKFPAHHYISNKIFNDFFGEKELFDNTRRISSAVANSDCLLYQIPISKLKALLNASDVVESNIDTYGEVELPEMEQTATNRINLSNSDKPISFNAAGSDAAGVNEDIAAATVKDSISNTLITGISEPPVLPEKVLEIDDPEIVIQDNNETAGIELEIPPALIGDKVPVKPEQGHSRDFISNQTELRETLDALLITHNQLTVYDTIQSVLFAAKKLLSSEAGEIYVVHKDAGEIGKYIEEEGVLKIKYHKISDGLTGTCVLQKKTLNFDEPVEDSRFIAEIDQPGEVIFKKILYVPLIAKNGVFVGVLQLARRENRYSDAEISKVELISNQAAAAIERGKRFEQILLEEKQKSNKSIYNFLEDNISIPADIINSYASILKKEKLSEKNKGVVILLQLQVKFFREIIKTAFDFNKPDFKLKLKKENLNTFLLGASEVLSEYCEVRNINLYRKTDNSAIVKFDAGKLFVAIYQLIKNACDASEQNGNVFISLETDANYAKIVVTDEGSGIEDYRKDNLFNPVFDFTKGRNSFGLTITKRIVDLHSGKIKFSSAENEGSIFTISLPLIEVDEIPSLLDHFEPVFKLDESANDFSGYLTDEFPDSAENPEQ
jgi:signal transduction histidine kinase